MKHVPAPVEILVCRTCRLAGMDRDGSAGPRSGTRLREALAKTALPLGITLREVACMSNCRQGCTITLRGGPRRWTYIYGRLDPELDIETIIEGAIRYRNAADGIVPWRKRPEHFRKNCIARVPPLEIPDE